MGARLDGFPRTNPRDAGGDTTMETLDVDADLADMAATRAIISPGHMLTTWHAARTSGAESMDDLNVSIELKRVATVTLVLDPESAEGAPVRSRSTATREQLRRLAEHRLHLTFGEVRHRLGGWGLQR
jgi:hypothetical protein